VRLFETLAIDLQPSIFAAFVLGGLERAKTIRTTSLA
jgi:hypothetical protein